MAKLYFVTTTKCPDPRPRKLKDGSVVYDIIFRIIYPDGKVHQKKLSGFKTKTLAKQAHTDFITQYCESLPKNFQIQKTGVIFDDAWNLYFKYLLGHIKESSCYTIRGKFNTHILPYFTGKHIDKITKQDFYAWQDTLLNSTQSNGQHYAPSTIRKIKSHFNEFLNWVDERYDIPNLLARVKLPKTINQPSFGKAFDFWEDTEFYQFIDQVDDILYKTLFMLLYFTGCRKGEAIAATESDYTPKGFHINKTFTNKTLDGSAYKITSSKAKRDFHVPIVDELKNQMTIYLQWKRDHKISSAFLFGGDQPISPETLRRKFDYYTDLAGVKRLHVHCLRHSCASLLIHHGASPQAVAEWLGDNVEQIYKTYGHLYESDKEKLCQKIKREITNL